MPFLVINKSITDSNNVFDCLASFCATDFQLELKIIIPVELFIIMLILSVSLRSDDSENANNFAFLKRLTTDVKIMYVYICVKSLI